MTASAYSRQDGGALGEFLRCWSGRMSSMRRAWAREHRIESKPKQPQHTRAREDRSTIEYARVWVWVCRSHYRMCTRVCVVLPKTR